MMSNAWRLRTTLYKKAVTSNDERIFIPAFDTGKTYSSELIAIGISVINSYDNWRYGGYVCQELNLSCFGYLNNNKAFYRSGNLLINNVSILKLNLLSGNSYKLRYFPPTYFADVRIQVWEYQGEKFDLLDEQLKRIESKIEQLY
ncbi:hypothetical protein [Pleurocapsa sp. FMAR1]|uniref:hypothetical protein n=1 Tax=Pleurocapsa sp. FMAR1 TaxID=3040204 RepID=UPI0029C68AA4|nr:hypothetical protein [Pleurocapsa sp. FMAR1]